MNARRYRRKSGIPGVRQAAALLESWRGYRASIARVAPLARPHRLAMGLVLLATFAFVAGRLLQPWPLKLLIDGVFLDLSPAWLSALAPDDTAKLLWLMGAMVAIVLLSSVARYAQRMLATKIGLSIAHDLRMRLFSHTQSLSVRFHGRRRSGDLVTRLMSDIRILRAALVGMPIMFLQEGLLLSGMIIVMLILDWRLTLIALLVLPFIVFLIKRNHGPMKAAMRQQRERAGIIASTAAEALGAVRVVQGYGAEKAEVKRFGKAAKRDLRSGLKTARLEAGMRWSTEIAVGLATATIAGTATVRIVNGSLTPGDLIIFTGYMASFYQPFRRLSRTLKRLNRAGAAGARVGEILDEPNEITDAPGAVDLPAPKGEIRFEGVCLDLGENRVLDDINLSIAAGERVVILGPIGAGKTSLTSLLPRFFDPDEGAVKIDGTDLRMLTLVSLRRQVATSFQEPILFAGTVAENIAFGNPEVDRARIEAAAKAVGMTGVVESLPDGFDTQVGEKGRWLSGGQRQAVSLCRAMLPDAPILILDEPTTGLDAEAVARLNASPSRCAGQRTVIMITHDMRSVKPGDRVIRMEAGRIVNDGTEAP